MKSRSFPARSVFKGFKLVVSSCLIILFCLIQPFMHLTQHLCLSIVLSLVFSFFKWLWITVFLFVLTAKMKFSDTFKHILSVDLAKPLGIILFRSLKCGCSSHVRQRTLERWGIIIFLYLHNLETVDLEIGKWEYLVKRGPFTSGRS